MYVKKGCGKFVMGSNVQLDKPVVVNIWIIIRGHSYIKKILTVKIKANQLPKKRCNEHKYVKRGVVS